MRNHPFATVAVVLLAFAGCSKPPPPGPPPPEVEVITVAPASVSNMVELPGRVQAVRTADVRARVDGIVERRVYEEGSDVKANQVLFKIDPRERRADYESALAALERNEATAANAAQVVDRYRPLVDQQAVSKQEYDAAVAQKRTGDADVADARAKVDRAKLAMGYTDVTAPIAGRVGRAEVTEGALVSASAATLMTRIEQLDPIYVNFSQSSSAVLALRRNISAGKIKVPEINDVQVTLLLEDGSPFESKGHLNFADMAIDEATGTVSLRSVFPNPGLLLLPGQFVRARIEAGVDPIGITVPQRAVNVSDQGSTVLLVGAEDKVVPQPVVLGSLHGDQWVITGGLKAGDRVIVNGGQMLRPGMPVRIAAPRGKPPGAAPDAPPAPPAGG